MNKKTLPPQPDFDSPEETIDIIHFLWNKLVELEARLGAMQKSQSRVNPSPVDACWVGAAKFSV